MENKLQTHGGSVYFASDFHLGAPDAEISRAREDRVVAWLKQVRHDMKALFLMGDVFDFWFEYKYVVPKGHVRLLGQLADIADAGIPVFMFTGNHDLWLRDYLEKEIGATIFHEQQQFLIDDKVFYLAHGDGLGPGDHGFKFMKKMFKNKALQWMFRHILHPDTGARMAHFFSGKSRAATGDADSKFLGEEREWLIMHSKEIMARQKVDFFIYGHRHYPMLLELPEGATYCNLGDWLKHDTYARFRHGQLHLQPFRQDN